MQNSVPPGWHCKALIEVADISRGTSWADENEVKDGSQDGLPVLGIKNVKSRLDLSNLTRLRGLKDSAISSSTVRLGDLLMIGSNGNSDRIGNVVRVDAEGHYLFASLLFGLRPNEAVIDRDFFYYTLMSPFVQSAISKTVQGTTGLSNLKISVLRDLPIRVPPLDEQSRIADVLQVVDSAIDANERVAAQYASVWHSLTEDLIWRLALDKPDYVEPLGAALSASDYGVNVPLSVDQIGVPILRMGNIQNGKIDFTDLKWGVVSEAEANALTLVEGDILFNRTNSRDLVGKVALVRDKTECLYASYLVRLSVNHNVADPYFLFAAMHSRRAQSLFKSLATPGVSQSNINPTSLKKQLVPLPALATQRAISGQLRSVENGEVSTTHTLDVLRAIKRDLLSDLLSGHKIVGALIGEGAPSSTTRTVQPAFKRAVLAAEVVHQLHKDAKFGSVKHEKIVHLCEYHADLHRDIDRHAYKKAAGPYDPKARRSVEANFKSHKWFDVKKAQGGRTEYVPMEKCGGHKEYFDRYFSAQRDVIQLIIDLLRPLDTQRCEIVATLYAVWNDHLLDGTSPTDSQIVNGARNNWHASKQTIPEDRWTKALTWMRQKHLVPQGTGEKTRVAPA